MSEIAYIDESYDDAVFAMSALIVPMPVWRDCFERLKGFRQNLKRDYGIFTSKELHATAFVAGRGRIGEEDVPRGLRAAIFHQTMSFATTLPNVRIISGAWPLSGQSQGVVHATAFGRIQDRLQKRCTTNHGHMMRIADEGREAELRKVARKAAVYNMVGSQFGVWEDGSRSRNIPTDRLIEDPVFKSSAESYFLQLVDFIAFALLKSESPAVSPRIRQYGLHQAYDKLRPICATEASPRDARGLGIIRK